MEKIQTLVDSFIDFEGKEHKFMIAAVSIEEPDTELTSSECEYLQIHKSVRLGVSVCNPLDEFDYDTAYRIAVGRAKANTKYALYTSQRGMINTRVVTALLQQESAYIKQNPGSVVSGYKEALEKYNHNKLIRMYRASLTESELNALNVLKTADQETLDKITELINA